jgi:hypothetical protein
VFQILSKNQNMFANFVMKIVLLVQSLRQIAKVVLALEEILQQYVTVMKIMYRIPAIIPTVFNATTNVKDAQTQQKTVKIVLKTSEI